MTLYQGLISFHFQEPVPDWTRAVAALPAYTIVKSVDNIGLLVEAQRVNSGITPFFRKWADHSPGQHYDGGDMATKRRRAREYFETFIGDPALLQLRRLIIGLWNEVYANSQTADEKQDRVEQEQAFSDVWQAEYAARFPFATLAMSSAAIGNDIPVGVAAIAHRHGYWMDYHAYVPVKAGVIAAGEWQWYSGRWTEMDRAYQAAGYTVRWLFGEGGPVRQFDGGGLDPEGGWRHPDCCNGDPVKYQNIMAYWAGKVKQWNAQHGRRAWSLNLFTTRQGGGAGAWTWFQTVQPEMDSMAALSGRFAESTAPPLPTPNPQPDPEPGPIDRRTQQYKVIAPAGLAIRKADWEQVGGLPVETTFWALPVTVNGKERLALRGHVSADPAHVQLVEESPVEPPPVVEPPEPVQLPGVDVSLWQGEIDWRLMQEQGVKVAGIKVSQGTILVDKQWRNNHQWARAYGIQVFPYHFFNNLDDPVAQARRFRSQYELVEWDYPPAGDFEDGRPATDLADNIRRFMQQSGAKIVYTSPGWWNGRVGAQEWAGEYLLWVANWKVERPTLPAGWSEWWGWQHSVAPVGKEYGAQSEMLDLDWFKALPQTPPVALFWPVATRALSVGGNTWDNPGGHFGADLAASEGDAVMAAHDGEVVEVGYQPGGYGHYVRVVNGDDSVATLYAHLSRVLTAEGMTVRAGDLLGAAGSTGRSTGSHLHFELELDGERVDPWPVLRAVE